jgi:two-component system CheB/CheR fusion protein
LTNAAKYTPPEGTISISLGRQQNEAVLCVSDTGEGISEGMLDKVFDLFVQSRETLDRSEGGMGVGLTLVRNLVSLHGGTVEATSEGRNKGSRFEIRLPLCPPPPSQRSDDADCQPCSGRRLRVLLVEDNEDSRRMLRMLLHRDGYEVHEAEDGLSGLEVLETCQPDVAILDIGLPGIDGYELARRIRRQHARNELFLVALTGYGQDSDRQAVQLAGFDAHLVKPLKREQLVELLRKVPPQAAPPAGG